MLVKKKEPSKAQKRKFTKGFWWGRVEHRLETYTTYILLIGILLQIIGLLERKWIWILTASGFFGIALILRFFAGISHKIEKHYMDLLRFGKWRKNK